MAKGIQQGGSKQARKQSEPQSFSLRSETHAMVKSLLLVKIHMFGVNYVRFFMVFPLFSLVRSPQSTLSGSTPFFASYITVFLAQTWHAVSAKKMFVLSMLVDQITSLLYFACKVVLFAASLHHFPFLQVEIMFDVLQNPVPNFEQTPVFLTNTSSKIPRTRSHFLQATSATFSKVARPASTMIPTWPCRAAIVPEDPTRTPKERI